MHWRVLNEELRHKTVTAKNDEDNDELKARKYDTKCLFKKNS